MEKQTALYLRVSTEAQADEGYSLAAQAEKLEAYCKMKGLGAFKRYVDGGFSGSNLSRPAMTELISEISQKKIARVVVYKLDRLSRSQKDTLYLIEDVFLPNGVDFVSINENIDTGSPYGRAMIGILSAFAQLERENIFLRTRMGMVERVKKGYWPGGGKIPFGYNYDSEKGILIPNSDAQTVREMYYRYLEGESTGSIARSLGMKYEHLVRQILLRESNTGVIFYKGETYPGRHQAIIEKEVFEKVKHRLTETNRPRATEGNKLLSGLLVCGQCGAKMRYQKWGKAGDKLVCYSRDKSKPHLVHDENCPNKGIMAKEVERIVIADLFKLAAKPKKTKPYNSDTRTIQKNLDRTTRKLRRLYELYAEAEDDTLAETITKTKKERERIQTALEKSQKEEKRKNSNDVRKALQTIESCWDDLATTEKQLLVRAVVDKIILQNEKIQIYYKISTEAEMVG